MKKYILFMLCSIFLASYAEAQINPIQNLFYEQDYHAHIATDSGPAYEFYMDWDEPQTPHDSLIGYNIYREDELYQFQTEKYLKNYEVLPSDDHQIGGNGQDFLFYDKYPFWAHVTAVYHYGDSIVESAYIDSVMVKDLDIGVKTYDKNLVHLFPNPTTGELNFSENVNVSVRNIEGKIISTDQNVNRIDLSGEASGVYFIEMETESHQKNTKKVILR